MSETRGETGSGEQAVPGQGDSGDSGRVWGDNVWQWPSDEDLEHMPPKVVEAWREIRAEHESLGGPGGGGAGKRVELMGDEELVAWELRAERAGSVMGGQYATWSKGILVDVFPRNEDNNWRVYMFLKAAPWMVASMAREIVRLRTRLVKR